MLCNSPKSIWLLHQNASLQGNFAGWVKFFIFFSLCIGGRPHDIIWGSTSMLPRTNSNILRACVGIVNQGASIDFNGIVGRDPNMLGGIQRKHSYDMSYRLGPWGRVDFIFSFISNRQAVLDRERELLREKFPDMVRFKSKNNTVILHLQQHR